MASWQWWGKIIKEKNAQKVIEKYFNHATIVEFYLNNLPELIKYLQEKLNPINEHFIESKIVFYINNNFNFEFDSLSFLTIRVVENLLYLEPESSDEYIEVEEDVTAINVMFNWYKYKYAGSNNVFSIGIPVNFVFNEYNYRIITEINNPILIEKTYGKDLEVIDFEKIANYIGKTALQEIKNRL